MGEESRLCRRRDIEDGEGRVDKSLEVAYVAWVEVGVKKERSEGGEGDVAVDEAVVRAPGVV